MQGDYNYFTLSLFHIFMINQLKFKLFKISIETTTEERGNLTGEQGYARLLDIQQFTYLSLFSRFRINNILRNDNYCQNLTSNHLNTATR